jgi:hypothetical protein
MLTLLQSRIQSFAVACDPDYAPVGGLQPSIIGDISKVPDVMVVNDRLRPEGTRHYLPVHDVPDWDAFERVRMILALGFSNSEPAKRYRGRCLRRPNRFGTVRTWRYRHRGIDQPQAGCRRK